MKSRFAITASTFAIGVAIAAVFAAAATAAPETEARDRQLGARSSRACYLVFRSVDAAASRCPRGVSATVVTDFWTGEISGYSCACVRKLAPLPQ